ncbi:ribulokinase [Pleomorphochaeta sp. DL1XJH-081]|uniref:ribulokinase n=1 Tax=Pleomorphochaeta sp. DL1XJH-081 TaxID=3409690 RepID=UPI003BB6748A
MEKGKNYVLGADFGSDSVRVVVIDAADGEVAGSAVSYYKRWKEGLYCDPKANQFRQHPLDYTESFEFAVNDAAKECKEAMSKVRAICVDTTGSTPCLCDENGTPLALNERFADNPDAMFILWKDHTAVKEADDFNALSHSWGGTDYTQFMGGTYSSEWFWSKLLHVARKGGAIVDSAVSAVEHCDWFSAVLTGTTALDKIKRGRCSAGHKIAWHASWGGYPSEEFLGMLHPLLVKVRQNLGSETYTSDQVAGQLTQEWSGKLGLPSGIPVCVGSYDAHIGAVGGHVAEGVMVKSIGTSTCDIIIGPQPAEGETERRVAGIAGQVDGSVVPGYIGYEAGQSAYGDFYAWFRNVLMWPVQNMGLDIDEETATKMEKKVLAALEKAAEEIEVTENSPVALDWINGRRTPNADQTLKGALSGLSLGTDAPAIMRMLLESTAYGARAILECFEAGGVKIDQIIAIGGVARKSKIGMQILADVTGREIQVTSNDQAPAIGAAAYASVAAGLYPDIPSAQKALCAPMERVHKPDTKKKKIYDTLYERYLALGAFEEKQRRG